MKTTLFLLLILLSGCSGAKLLSVATEGEVTQDGFTKTIPFDYAATKHLFIDVVIEGKTYNFLFDTGWDVTSISQELGDVLGIKKVAKQTVTGSSMEKHKTKFGFLPKLTIAGIDFQNIGVGMEDLSFITSTRSDGKKVDGVIGANVLKKLYWQIDYNKQTIKFSDKLKNLAPSKKAYQVPMISKNAYDWGANKIEVQLNNSLEQFVFDTGSYGSFTGGFDLKERLASTQSITKIEGNVITIENLTLGEITLKNTEVNIEEGVALLLGNGFLENYTVTMDWKNKVLYLNPNSSER